MTPSRLPVVKLFGRPDCHLCDEARKGLEVIRREGSPFTLVEVDIDSDDGLLRAMLERIPVVEVGGREVCDLGLDEAAVKAALATVSE